MGATGQKALQTVPGRDSILPLPLPALERMMKSRRVRKPQQETNLGHRLAGQVVARQLVEGTRDTTRTDEVAHTQTIIQK